MRPQMRISATVLSAGDPQALGAFYARLLGWTIVTNEPVWVMVRPPSAGTGLSFQLEPDYVQPVWPTSSGQQQMMSHLDIAVDDLDTGVTWALEQGATLADHQPQEHVRVMLDPAGHPFCLTALYDSAAAWRHRAIDGVLHSGTLVNDPRSEQRSDLPRASI